MTKFISFTIPILVALALAAGSAHAQPTPKFEYGKADPEAAKLDAPVWSALAQAGLMITSGNSRQTTFSAGASASRKAGDNKLAIDAFAAYTRSRILLATDANANGLIGEDELEVIDQTTTKAWNVKARYDRFLTDRNSLYVSFNIGADEPAGKELMLGAQLGYSRLLFKNAMHELAAEIGADYSREEFVAAGDAINIISARGFVGYVGTLSADTSFIGSAELLTNLNEEQPSTGVVDPLGDNRFTGKTGLTTKLTSDISFRAGITAKYDSAPAPRTPFPGTMGYEPGVDPFADKLDMVVEAQIIVNIL
jgi:hypothetical protein